MEQIHGRMRFRYDTLNTDTTVSGKQARLVTKTDPLASGTHPLENQHKYGQRELNRARQIRHTKMKAHLKIPIGLISTAKMKIVRRRWRR